MATRSRGGFISGPEIDYLERAFDDSANTAALLPTTLAGGHNTVAVRRVDGAFRAKHV